MKGETIYERDNLTIVRNPYLKKIEEDEDVSYYYEYQLFSNHKFRLQYKISWNTHIPPSKHEFEILDEQVTETILRDYQKIIDSGEQIKQWEQ